MNSTGGVSGIGAPLSPNRIGDDGSFAMGTEMLTDGGLENWTGDTPDDWDEGLESAGVKDILNEGVHVHAGSNAAKLVITNNDGSVLQLYQATDLVINKYYSLSGWVDFDTRTAGTASLLHYTFEHGSQYACQLTATVADYTYYELVFKLTGLTNQMVVGEIRNETTTGIVYFDDISMRDVDLIARRYGGALIGAIGMQQIDLWDKWKTPQ